jgi:S1-C subfamily serine protease
VPPFTTFSGLYERATGQPPFDLDSRWIAARGKLDPDTIFDISTTNDIIGGNSGSPLIDAKGEVIGAIFDGNIHSLGGDYGYDPVLNRAVAVSTAAVSEALRKVYGADALAAELGAVCAALTKCRQFSFIVWDQGGFAGRRSEKRRP